MDYTFIKGQFTEAQLEEAIIALLEQQGYTYVHGESIHRKYEDILLLDDLRAFMQDRYTNDGLSEVELQKITNRLQLIPASPLYSGNRETFWLIKVSARKSMKCFALFSPAALQNGHRDFWKW